MIEIGDSYLNLTLGTIEWFAPVSVIEIGDSYLNTKIDEIHYRTTGSKDIFREQNGIILHLAPFFPFSCFRHQNHKKRVSFSPNQ